MFPIPVSFKRDQGASKSLYPKIEIKFHGAWCLEECCCYYADIEVCGIWFSLDILERDNQRICKPTISELIIVLNIYMSQALFYTLLHVFFFGIFTTLLRSRHYYLPFTEEETDTEKLSDMPMITDLGRVWLVIHVRQSQSRALNPCAVWAPECREPTLTEAWMPVVR